MQCTADYTLTQADVDAGLVNNLGATATLATVYNSAVSATSATSAPSSTSIPIQGSSSMTMVKTTTSTPTKANDPIVYNYLVTNTGTTTIHNVAIDEMTFTGHGTLGTPACVDDTLAPGAQTTCSLTYTVTQADVDAGSVVNTAEGTATDSANKPVSSESSTAPVTIDPAPELDLTKSVNPTTADTADTHVDYAFEITNNGNVTVNNLAINETAFSGTGTLGTPACTSTPLGASLAPGETTTCHADYVLTQADVNAGTVTNTATASGTAHDITPVTSAESSAPVTITQSPALTVDKQGSRPGVDNPLSDIVVGQTINYTFAVTNTGNVTINSIAIDETNFTGTNGVPTVSCPVTTLDPGEMTVCTATHTVSQDDMNTGYVVNTAHATGNDPASQPISSDDSMVRIPGNPTPEIQVYKTHADLLATPPHEGDTVNFTITATNIGNVTLNNVIVADSKTGDPTCDTTTLAPGAVATCTVAYKLTQADIDAGSLLNTATATGRPLVGATATDSANDTVPLTADPSMTVAKSADTALLAQTGVVNYTIKVTNTGNVTLAPLAVTDPGPAGGHGTMSAVACDATSLAPGVSTTCTASFGADQTDIDRGKALVNTATATGEAPSGDEVSATGSAPVGVSAKPHLTLSKQAGVPAIADPEVIDYTFTVLNDGNTTLDSIAVTDLGPKGCAGHMSDVTCDATTLAPGADTTCRATYQASQDDIDAGNALVNTATASGTDPVDPTIRATSDPAQATVNIQQAPGVEMAKTVDTATVTGPGVITYNFAVHNTGDVSLTNVQIVEGTFTGAGAMPTPSCPATPLEPGDTMNCTATYTVTQADIDAGTAITNTATATAATPARSTLNSDASTATTDVTQTPGIHLDKTGTLNGQSIHYVYTVTNTGTVTLNSIAVAETNFTGHGTMPTPSCPAATLAPGQAMACTADYQLAPGDAGSTIVNDATVTGELPSGDPTDPSSSGAKVAIASQAEASVTVPGITVQTGAVVAPASPGWLVALLLAAAAALCVVAWRKREQSA